MTTNVNRADPDGDLQLQESDNLWDDLGLKPEGVTKVIETVKEVRNPSLVHVRFR